MTTTEYKQPNFFSAGTVLLLLMFAFGVLAGIFRLLYGLGPSTNLSDEISWGLWKHLNVMTGVALSAGGFTIAATVYILNLKKYKALARPAVLVAFAGYSTVSISLLFDIGRPLTFWHPLATWQPHSMLFEIIWCLSLYTLVLVLEFSPVVLEKFGQEERAKKMRSKKVMIPLVIAAVTLSFLHQSSLGGLFLLMKGRLSDLWWTTMLPWNFIISAIGVALAVTSIMVILSARIFHYPLDKPMLQGLVRGTAVTLAVYTFIRLGDILLKGNLALAFAGNMEGMLFLLEMTCFIGAMILLFTWARSDENRILLTQIFAVLGVILNRFNVVYLSQVHTEVSYFPSWQEIGLVVGQIAFILLLYRAAMLYLPVMKYAQVKVEN
jgi:Ni/Fe-hydrogenase subunit HybB-like protein